jgi:hypothetical protein
MTGEASQYLNYRAVVDETREREVGKFRTGAQVEGKTPTLKMEELLEITSVGEPVGEELAELATTKA